VPVTLDEMIYHTKIVRRGVKRAMLVADMPFQSYEAAPWEAAVAAGRFVKEGNAAAVKLEGGERVAESVRAILKAKIPVMGHLGLTPQSFHEMGGYKVQGREKKEAAKIFNDAKLLEKLGVFAVVLEGIPVDLAKRISKQLRIPTIGIGAGPHCDGQVLVLDDLLGMGEGASPKFVAQYANLRPIMNAALKKFASDVRRREFPKDVHSYH
jgi:3-methyl-2-oxobutanoate hydroxymethyltransferase